MHRNAWMLILVVATVLIAARGSGLAPAGVLVQAGSAARHEPARVGTPAGVTFAAAHAGGTHSLALDGHGDAWAWGSNYDGQLGDRSVVDAFQPTRVAMPEGVSFTQVSAGFVHSLALDEEGRVWAWGRNGNGQLGTGTTLDQYAPTRVELPPELRFTMVAAGGHHSLALDEGGVVWSWGANGDGQLGDGSTSDRSRPVRTARPPGVTFANIHAGWRHSIALDENGDAWAWGLNDDGQLGDATASAPR